MRHLQSESHFRHALFALQDPEGYVDSLLEQARAQTSPRRAGVAVSPSRYDLRLGVNRRPASLY